MPSLRPENERPRFNVSYEIIRSIAIGWNKRTTTKKAGALRQKRTKSRVCKIAYAS
jgi:hypothetical protein